LPVGLASAGLALNYDDWINQGYRWVTADGPFACVSKSDLWLITKDRSDGLELKMIEQLRAYYLVRGTMVQVVFLLRFLEKLVEYLFAGGSLKAIPEYVATHFTWDRFYAIQIWIFVLFLIYTSVEELNARLGDGELMKIFFTRRSSGIKPTLPAENLRGSQARTANRDAYAK
jgi:hypothetical protein